MANRDGTGRDGTGRDGTDPDEIASRLAALGSATLGESGGLPMPPRIKAAWTGARLVAPAFPVGCAPADNLAVHLAVTLAPPGSALVVDASAVPDRGYWGEVLTTAAESRGIRGLVIDGCVRDTEALARHGFPVFSAGVALPGAAKVAGGSAGRALQVAGVGVAAGDWVVADGDGVVVVARSTLDDVLAAGEGRERKEADMMGRLRQGATTLELLGLDPSSVLRDGA